MRVLGPTDRMRISKYACLGVKGRLASAEPVCSSRLLVKLIVLSEELARTPWVLVNCAMVKMVVYTRHWEKEVDGWQVRGGQAATTATPRAC